MLFLAVGALLAGCASSSAASSTSSSAPSSTGPATTGPTSVTTTFDEATNARQDITTPTACQRDAAGVWIWRGTLTNRGTVRHSYRIIVDFTDASATVLQTKIVRILGLAPGATTQWSVSGAATFSDVLCVIRNARIT